jgi:hypothetical protein
LEELRLIINVPFPHVGLFVGNKKGPDRLEPAGPGRRLYMDNTDLPLKRLPDAEVCRRLDNVQDLLLNESFGGDDEARCELMEERHLLFKELKRRGILRPPVRTKNLQPNSMPLCAHERCGLP